MFISAGAHYYYDRDEKSKAAKKVIFVNETLPFYMKKFDTIVGEHGYVANGKVSYYVSKYFNYCLATNMD